MSINDNLTPEEIETLQPFAFAISRFIEVLYKQQAQNGVVGASMTLTSVFSAALRFAVEHPESALYWVNTLADVFGEEWTDTQRQVVESFQEQLAPRYELP